jgi:hypothetical protein
MEEKTRKNRKCIVKHYRFDLYYHDGYYVGELYNAKIFNLKELQEDIKYNPKNEIIFLDTEKGLELLVEEIEKLPHRIEQEDDEDEVKRMKEGLERLKNSNPEMIDKYTAEHTKRYPSIIGFHPERRRLIIKEIVSGRI